MIASTGGIYNSGSTREQQKILLARDLRHRWKWKPDEHKFDRRYISFCTCCHQYQLQFRSWYCWSLCFHPLYNHTHHFRNIFVDSILILAEWRRWRLLIATMAFSNWFILALRPMVIFPFQSWISASAIGYSLYLQLQCILSNIISSFPDAKVMVSPMVLIAKKLGFSILLRSVLKSLSGDSACLFSSLLHLSILSCISCSKSFIVLYTISEI